jgi:arabinan endo-1,5-alpha-L-arabinosidase
MIKRGSLTLICVVATGAAFMGASLGQTSSPAATAPAARKALTALTAGALNLNAHDPSTLIRCKDEYWVFYTGTGVPSAHSKDLINWQQGPRVVQTQPAWAATAVPGNQRNDCWAPDVMKVGDQYFLYYSVSTFGSPISAIGLATNPTLDPADKDFKWTDQGPIISSQRSDNFNAIDPAVAKDTEGGLWLAFGSFWSGIKMIQLDPRTGKRIAPNSRIYSLAANNEIEAACIHRHDKHYYLFVNWGRCCNGAASTYNIRVGRSEKITGPYLDRAGRDMANGGGTLVLENEGQFIGPGHAGIIEVNGKEWFSMHYEAAAGVRARSPLGLRPLSWDKEGWPVVERVSESPVTIPASTSQGSEKR